jgi:glucose/arabinose dehydrogenase
MVPPGHERESRPHAPRAIGLLLGVVLAASPAAAQPVPEVALELVAEALERPTGIAHAGDSRLFVALQDGEVWIVRDGAVDPQPFLDITDRVTSKGEQGLLSIAFHPAHAENGWFFVHYTDGKGDTVVSRFTRSSDPDRADPTSEAVLLRIVQLFSNHNGGQLAFGPDGMLYVAIGDDGRAFDPFCNAQDRSKLLGKILRLDVDANPETPPHHGVPADNPYRGSAAFRGEIWAYGLRNPWRFSFDRETGDLYLADVGQNAREEVNFVASGSPGGLNFGWKVMEGDLCTGDATGCTVAFAGLRLFLTGRSRPHLRHGRGLRRHRRVRLPRRCDPRTRRLVRLRRLLQRPALGGPPGGVGHMAAGRPGAPRPLVADVRGGRRG